VNDRDIAEAVLEALHEGIVAWRYPFNVMPELAMTFGKFFQGEPMAKASYAELDAIIAATGAKITHHWRCRRPVCDRPPKDRILMPPRSYFSDEPQYRGTLIHEVLHYLEAPWRVGWIGSDDQSEMVSEIGTGLLESYLRLPHDQDNANIEKWLPYWDEGIRRNHRYLFDSIAQAERAVNYLLDLRRRKEAA
jgi:antirestriction protein ArdC